MTLDAGYAFNAEGNQVQDANGSTFTSSYNFWGLEFGTKNAGSTLTNNMGFIQEEMTKGSTTNIEFGTTGAGMYAARVTVGTQPTEYFNSDAASHLDLHANTNIDLNIGGSEVATISAAGIVTTGTILGKINVITDATTADTISADEMNGSFFHYTNTGAVTITLPIPVAGMSGCFYDNSATGILTIDPVDGVDTITLDGTTLAAGVDIDSPGAKGDFICLIATGVDTWLTLSRSGTWILGT